jgi:hypothetical protein
VQETARLLSLPLWKILAFCEPSWFIDSEAVKKISKARLLLQARSGTPIHATKSFYDDPQMVEWASTGCSSLIIFEGSFQTLNVLEQISVELIDHFSENHQKVAWILNPGTYHGINVTELPGWGISGMLKQIAVEIIRHNVSFESLDHLAMLHGIFHNASSSQDWFKVIENTLKSCTLMYLVMNVGVLGSKSAEADCLPGLFLKLFETLAASSETALKVMLLNPRPFMTQDVALKVPIIRIPKPKVTHLAESYQRNAESSIKLPILTRSKHDQGHQVEPQESESENILSSSWLAAKSKGQEPRKNAQNHSLCANKLILQSWYWRLVQPNPILRGMYQGIAKIMVPESQDCYIRHRH